MNHEHLILIMNKTGDITLNIKYILTNFDCNYETGEIFRVLTGGVRTLAGTVTEHGYVKLSVDGVLHYGHRVIWCHYYRENPPEFIDHINRVRDDNSIKNLRACTLSENQMNRKVSKNNTTGYTGVSFMKGKKKFKATIYENSKPIYLGLYDTAKEASEAYELAKQGRG